MSECNHVELKKTVGKTDDGGRIYYCAAKCGAGLFVVRPLVIGGRFGLPAEKKKS